MCTLYVMVGIPGSGKSTWANNFIKDRKNIVYISRDVIRFGVLKSSDTYFAHESDVFTKFVDAIVANLKYGSDVIADATHLSIASRRKLVNALTAHGLQSTDYRIIFVFVDTLLAVCIQRDDARTNRQHVGASIIGRMHTQLVPPSILEQPNAIEVWHIQYE